MKNKIDFVIDILKEGIELPHYNKRLCESYCCTQKTIYSFEYLHKNVFVKITVAGTYSTWLRQNDSLQHFDTLKNAKIGFIEYVIADIKTNLKKVNRNDSIIGILENAIKD